MNLILEIVNTPSVDIFQQSMSFDERGGKIGRSKTAKWTLNDPTKHISNFHAEISFKDGQYFITDISSNGMSLKTPPKKFVKGIPVPLDQKSAVMIGDYVIAVKTIENAFASSQPMSSSSPATAGIPDTFFVGDAHKEAFGVIGDSAPEEKDIVSLLDNNKNLASSNQDMLLPELDNIMGIYDESELVLNDSLSTHIDAPTFETEQPLPPTPTEQPSTQSVNEDTILKILSLKLGVPVEKMSTQEKELFVSEVAELALTALDKVRNTHHALEKIQTQLGVISTKNKQGYNPLKTAPNNKEILSNLNNYSPSVSHHIKDLFHEIDIHTIAFYTAFKNISFRTAQKFSPEKLYFNFEKKNALNKSFTNKKALAWEAYCEQFKYLDSIEENDIDLSELQKEYNSVLETLNLSYNT
jgi:type VI secretion system protein ImpI